MQNNSALQQRAKPKGRTEMTNAKLSYAQAIDALKAHKGAATNDIACVLNADNIKYGFTESTLKEGQKRGIDWSVICKLPQKQVKRTTQLVNALASKNYANLDYTHARELIALREAKEYGLTTKALVVMTAGARSGDINNRGISLSRIDKLMSAKHGITTTPAKTSNSTGKTGIFTVMGMTSAKQGEQNHNVTLNEKSPMVQWFFTVLDAATDGQIVDMGAPKKVK